MQANNIPQIPRGYQFSFIQAEDYTGILNQLECRTNPRGYQWSFYSGWRLHGYPEPAGVSTGEAAPGAGQHHLLVQEHAGGGQAGGGQVRCRCQASSLPGPRAPAGLFIQASQNKQQFGIIQDSVQYSLLYILISPNNGLVITANTYSLAFDDNISRCFLVNARVHQIRALERYNLWFGALAAMRGRIFFAIIWRSKKVCRIWPGAGAMFYPGNPSGSGPRFKFYFEKIF